MSEYDSTQSTIAQPDPKPGPFLAKVVSLVDPTNMGILEVEILRPVGGSSSEGQLHQVKYMSPFYGQTNVIYNGQGTDYNNTQKSYGMWMIPPDPGNTVIVIFIDGDPKRGYWIGCVPDENMDFMTPGLAATEAVVEGAYTTSTGDTATRVPVAEYNKKDASNSSPADSTTLQKPTHPFTKVLDAQGLLLDDTRGITTSSARREAPSMVFGISTPGPLDKQDGAQTGNYGKAEHLVTGAPVSRLGGTTFVMDDGDDKFLRKQAPGDGPPDYAAVEENETGGDVTRPHNELFRIRTRTGHQILLHNTEDLIYITNSRGTAWIELTSNGKIDIYSEDSISVHTGNDINFSADRDINFSAGENVNITAGTNINQQAGSAWNSTSGTDSKITAGADAHILSGGTIALDGSPDVHLNSKKATKADPALKPVRVPQTEPWAGHENLDPASVTPDNTMAVETPATPSEPAAFKKYSTSIDTFARNPPPANS